MILPIFDLHGRITAFAGRNLGTEGVKYKNSRYDKSKLLFGLNHARKGIQKKKRAIVVEGYFDAMQLWNCGLSETVACQGTALTKEHMKSLSALTTEVILLFDGDDAGRKASLKLVGDALKVGGLSLQLAFLPEGEDPDSFVRKYGREKIEDLLSKSRSLTEVAIEQCLREENEQRYPEVIRKKFFPWLEKITDPIEKAYLIKKIANYSGVSGSLLHTELGSKRESIHPVQKREEQSYQDLSPVVVGDLPKPPPDNSSEEAKENSK